MTSFGPGGYPDGQRVANYDSPALWVDDPGLVTAQDRTSPILNVSRYAYLCGQFGETQSQSQVQITWYLDAAGAVAVGRRTFQLDFNIGLAQFRTVNLGPYVQVVRTATVFDATYGPESWVFASNRDYPLEFIPINPLLIDEQNVTLGAGASLTMYPLGYYAGPIQLWTDLGAPSLVNMRCLVAGGGWHYIAQLGITTTPSQAVYEWVAPSGAWQITFENNGAGAAGFYLAVTPSLTGST